jgi:membrane protein implicated in regulation of membrane protease activity
VTVFLAIGFIGLALLTISLLAGDFLDGVASGLDGDWFSTAALGGFVSAFGFGSAAVDGAGAPALVTGGAGIATGVAFGWFAAWLTRIVKGGASDTTPEAGDSIGREATVITAIPAGGFGAVKVPIGGHTLRYNARADAPIEAGTPVHVTGVLSPTAVTVAPIWSEPT